jgi:hypothetical protein
MMRVTDNWKGGSPHEGLSAASRGRRLSGLGPTLSALGRITWLSVIERAGVIWLSGAGARGAAAQDGGDGVIQGDQNNAVRVILADSGSMGWT